MGNSSGNTSSWWYFWQCTTVTDKNSPGFWWSAFWRDWNVEKLPNTTVMDKAVISFLIQLLTGVIKTGTHTNTEETANIYSCLIKSSVFCKKYIVYFEVSLSVSLWFMLLAWIISKGDKNPVGFEHQKIMLNSSIYYIHSPVFGWLYLPCSSF